MIDVIFLENYVNHEHLATSGTLAKVGVVNRAAATSVLN